MKQKRVGLLILAMGLFIASCAGTYAVVRPDPTRLPEEVLKEYVSAPGKALPGVAVSVIRGGKTVYRAAVGVRKSGSPEPVTISDAFHIGSDTKAMTALLCGILVDRDLLSWDTTLGQVLGVHYPMRKEYRGVTLAQLLSHTSGLHDGLSRETWRSFYPYDSPAGQDRPRMVAEALALEPAHAPGSKYLYANLGYVVAGFLAERATGKSWETLMREVLFAPLGMDSAGFGPPGRGADKAITVSAPWGHDPEPVDPAYLYADNPAALGPAGTVHANLRDIERYLAVYGNHGKDGAGRRIVSEAVLEELLKPRLENYALGWAVGVSDQGRRFITHSGSNNTFNCTIAVFPDAWDAVIVFTNRGDRASRSRMAELVLYLLERFLDTTVTRKG